MKQSNNISRRILTTVPDLPSGIGQQIRPANIAIIASTTFVLLSVLAMTGVIPAMVSSVCLMAAALFIRWNCSPAAGRIASIVGTAMIILTAVLHEVRLLDMISIGAVLLASAEWIGSLKRSFEAEKAAADYDALTGAVSHYAIRRTLISELEQVRRGSKQFALLFLDLDNFKGINDRDGHAAGDAVLKSLVAQISQAIGPNNSIARLGGDEFLILLRDVEGRLEVYQMGVELIQIVSSIQSNLSGSIGGLVIDQKSAGDLDDILSEADDLMYSVKRDGKANLKIAGAEPPQLELVA